MFLYIVKKCKIKIMQNTVSWLVNFLNSLATWIRRSHQRESSRRLNRKDAMSVSSQQEPMEKCQKAQCDNDYQD